MMSEEDPYNAVRAEIDSALASAGQLRASFVRIRAMQSVDGEELGWARNELKAALTALDADVDELDLSVRAVEESPSAYGVTRDEVWERRRYVERVRREIQTIRADMGGPLTSRSGSEAYDGSAYSPSPFSPASPFAQNVGLERDPLTSSAYSPRFRDDTMLQDDGLRSPFTPHSTGLAGKGEREYANPFASPRRGHEPYGMDSGFPAEDSNADEAAWARDEEALLMQEQDRTMDTIAGTLRGLARQAGLMGEEIAVHNELLTDLEQDVDSTSGRLESSLRRLRKFARDTEASGSGWCVMGLILILVILLVVAIVI
ncbi:hypothetical protein CYLTODRAFT_426011 [Cylindrobasidium torrendii FP15055 ss-10]|uniref:t-SNARE coiled-coil homology domain-containing protein n=1 Tax=Cylindrobasidium torrendii FP15055 ss-10 TaxID=1314674 RepID=A0A0D7AYW5_9AGAR|nr:hypothetical protein CYLTODRAFT_426011 [Cylindrobasidium torrendii FP15055 ss-10]